MAKAGGKIDRRAAKRRAELDPDPGRAARISPYRIRPTSEATACGALAPISARSRPYSFPPAPPHAHRDESCNCRPVPPRGHGGAPERGSPAASQAPTAQGHHPSQNLPSAACFCTIADQGTIARRLLPTPSNGAGPTLSNGKACSVHRSLSAPLLAKTSRAVRCTNLHRRIVATTANSPCGGAVRRHRARPLGRRPADECDRADGQCGGAFVAASRAPAAPSRIPACLRSTSPSLAPRLHRGGGQRSACDDRDPATQSSGRARAPVHAVVRPRACRAEVGATWSHLPLRPARRRGAVPRPAAIDQHDDEARVARRFLRWSHEMPGGVWQRLRLR